jgi:hypothetical protein
VCEAAAQASTINIASVADVKDGYDPSGIIYLVEDAVVADSNAPALAAGELAAIRRTGICRERDNRVANPNVGVAGKRA